MSLVDIAKFRPLLSSNYSWSVKIPTWKIENDIISILWRNKIFMIISVFHCKNYREIKLITNLSVGFSSLREHKFNIVFKIH